MALLVITALFVLCQLYSAIPLIAPMSSDLDGDVTFALSTAFSLCYAIGFLIWGPLADQCGRKRILLIGLALLTATTFAASLANTIPVLGMLRAVQGLAAASFAPVALTYLAESVPPARRPLAFGAISTAFLAAGITGQVFASAVALAHLTLLLGFVGMYTALGSHLTTLGSDDSQVIWFRLVGLPGMFASLAVGPLTRRLGVSGVARLGFTIATAGLAAEALLSGSLVAISMTSLVYVAGVALAIPAMIAAFGETAAPNRAGGMALNGFVLFVGASVGPLIAGLPLPFPILLLCFAGFSALAVVSLTVYSGLDRRREALL